MMDTIGWFIDTMHQFLGHDKAAAAIGVPAGDKTICVICEYERNPTSANKQAVIDALSNRRPA